MDTNQNIDEKISDLHEKAKQLLSEDIQEKDIISELIKEGITSSYAEIIIENVKSDISDKRNFWKEFFTGIAITVVGFLLNYLSFAVATRSGTLTFILFWGIVVFGISVIIRAFIIFRK